MCNRKTTVIRGAAAGSAGPDVVVSSSHMWPRGVTNTPYLSEIESLKLCECLVP